MLSLLLDLVYPRICPSCSEPLQKAEQQICFRCYDELAFCPYLPHQTHPIEKIFWGRCVLHSATSLLTFTKHGVGQKLLHQLKYKGDTDTGIYLGNLLARKIETHPQFSSVECIVPVPLYVKKKHQRGYNQSEVVGRGISNELNIPILDKYLIKERNTSSQTRKNRLERVENISGSFRLMEDFPSDSLKHILLIDDVITTGSTLEACINLLAAKHTVSVATIAYQ